MICSDPQHGARNTRIVLFLVIVLQIFSLSGERALAQTVESPDRRFLFLEDRTKRRDDKKKRKEIQVKQHAITEKAKESGFPFDINATNVEYDSAAKKIKGKNGVIIGYANSVIEAEEGEIAVEEKTATLRGDVRITDVSGNISADEVELDLKDGTGTMTNADVYFEQGGYRVKGKEVKKIGLDDYTMKSCDLSTCDCAESGATNPWTISAEDGKITRNGYGQIWNGALRAYDTPIMYLPWMIFPVKTERQSGFLPGSFGTGRRSGFNVELPLFLAFDRSADATITGVYQSQMRYGLDTEFRKYFSRRTRLQMGGLYFNESQRDGELLGTDITDLADPTLDTNRLAGYLNFDSLDHEVLGQDLQFIVRGKYVSDDLILREYDRPEIGPYNTRFVTSRATMRLDFLESYSLDTAAEYNQAMFDNDDFLFQRAPDVNLSGLHTFYPFGRNQFGAKLRLSDSVGVTTFLRQKNYDGTKAEVYEQLGMPFHVENYFDGVAGFDVRATKYKLENREEPFFNPATGLQETRLLPEESDRILPGFSAQVSTGVEKVYDVGDSNPLKWLTELGSAGRSGELVRVKHAIEPTVRYRFVPTVGQDDNPQFESTDRLPRRDLVTYGVMQRFYGRFEGRDEYLYGVEEATPEMSDLGQLSSRSPLDQRYDVTSDLATFSDYVPANHAARRELLNFKIAQTYDFDIGRHEALLEKQTGRDLDPFSDLELSSALMPNEYIRFSGGLTVDPDAWGFSSYQLGSQLLDKRGDQIRGRITFIDDAQTIDGQLQPLRQAEASAEFRVTDRLLLGFYGRYDDVRKEWFEKKMGMRFKSACKCWVFDVDLWDRLNPDETRVMVNLTLVGIGEFGNNLFTQRPRESTAAAP